MVYITGDTHGDIARFQSKPFRALKSGDTLIVCGDFGFLWDNSRREQNILRKLAAKKYNICFVDGTHENFDMLNAYDVSVWNGGKVHRITQNIYHLMRGQIFTIDNLKIFTFGGGESFDRAARKEHNTWWMEEMPNPEQLYEGAKNIDRAGCRVDVIVTHEPTARVKGMLRLEVTDTVKICGLNRYFEELAQICSFKHWYFGAMHCDHSIPPNQTAVFKELICLDEAELAPPQPTARLSVRRAYSENPTLYKPRREKAEHAQTSAQLKQPENEPERKKVPLQSAPTREAVTTRARRSASVQSPPQPNSPARAETPRVKPASEESYSAAYRDITKLIDSILAEDKK